MRSERSDWINESFVYLVDWDTSKAYHKNIIQISQRKGQIEEYRE
jgi:hypothetical protein